MPGQRAKHLYVDIFGNYTSIKSSSGIHALTYFNIKKYSF